MAQRAANFSRKPKAQETAFASLSAADVIRAPAPLREIPLDLTQFIAPFRRHGRLSLRLEGVPQLARLSAGRNNGDGSWSLASDELAELAYLLPENLCKEHALAVRIMAIDDTGVSTLKMFDCPILPAGPAPLAATEQDTGSPGTPDAEIALLHGALSDMQVVLAARDSELAGMRLAAERARAKAEAELAAARAAWDRELAAQLSAAAEKAAADRELDRRAQQLEDQARLAALEARTQQRIAEEGDRWQSLSRSILSEAQARWATEEAARRQSARAEWEQQSQRERADAAERREELELALAARMQQQAAPSADPAELGRLRDEAEALKAALMARAAELAAQRGENERQRERERQAFEASLLAAQAAWRREEAARLAAAETRLREEWTPALAGAAERCARLEAELAQARAENTIAAPPPQSGQELDGLRNALAAAQAALKERDGELARQRLEGEQQRERERQGLEAVETRLREAEAALQASLKERESELARQRLEMERERETWRQEADASLANARNTWKALEAARLTAAEEQWQARLNAALAEAKARHDAAELALERARTETANALSRDNAYVGSLRKELAALQAALVDREAELGLARAERDQTQLYDVPKPAYLPLPGGFRNTAEPEGLRAADAAKRRLIRDAVLVVCLVVPAIFFYPRLMALVPQDLIQDIAASLGGSASPAPAPPAPFIAVAPGPAASEQTALVVRGVNLRATPSTSAEVVTTLPRNGKVIILERQGNWTHVRIAAAGTPLEGWVFSSYLGVPAGGQP